MTIAQRQFLTREPDAGTVFVWVGKALGPKPRLARRVGAARPRR